MSTYTNTITSIAIGSFDGIHIAHQTLISQADGVVVIERHAGYLTPGFKRSWYTDKPLFLYLFDTVRGLSAAAFVARLEADFPALERIVVGYDFGFGQGREGDADHLRALFRGEVVIVPEVRLNGVSVHSRVIREQLVAGEIEAANALLGRAYRIDGDVMVGQGLGARELVPTLNLHVRDYQLPQEGVYVTRTRIGQTWYPSVSFLGHRVSTDGMFAVETHVLDHDMGVVTGRVCVEFLTPIRENQTFDSLEALKRQIIDDISIAREFSNKMFMFSNMNKGKK